VIHRDEADLVRDAVIADLRGQVRRLQAVVIVAALAGVLGGAALGPYLGAALGVP
jgi:hypothetical protein